MDFASKFILFNEEDEYECISDEELERGMQVSDSGSDEDGDVLNSLPGSRGCPSKRKKLKHHWRVGSKSNDAEPQAQDRSSGSSPKTPSKRSYRRADTNIVSVNFSTLLLPSNMHAGEPVECGSCHSILSHISKVNAEKVWQCEFCGESAVVDVEAEEIPVTEDVTFLLEPALSTSTSTMSGMDQSLVVFCVDTSGSMCVTTQISGKIKLRGSNYLRRLQRFNEGNVNQFLPSQRDQDVTYISRLQAMQAAVDHQLEQMSKNHPNRRVALITFNNEVTIVGDGTQPETIVAGDKLTSDEQLCKIGSELALPQAIKSSRKVLGEKVYSLEEGGATALGPALIIAVNMAAHHPGSKVILCTDGKANIGLGKLEDAVEEQAASEFYSKTAGMALEHGVTLSVITIGGTDCKLVHLGMLADKTGGQVNIVDPLKLTEEFGNILADPVIATKVKATFILHKELYIIDENDPNSQLSRAENKVGNVHSSTTITFEFARKQKTKDLVPGTSDQKESSTLEASQAVVLSEVQSTPVGATAASSTPAIKDLPFQLQIEYYDTEGNKALRVITRSMPATSERKVTEENANLDILGLHVAKKSAELALQGQFSKSRSVAFMNQRLAWRHSHSELASEHDRKKYKAIYSRIQRMENTVHSKLKQEIQDCGHSKSDSENSDDEQLEYSEASPVRVHPIMPPTYSAKGVTATKFKKMHLKRSSDMDDSMANMMYRFRSVGTNEISAPLAITDKTAASNRGGDNKAAASNPDSDNKSVAVSDSCRDDKTDALKPSGDSRTDKPSEDMEGN